MSEPLGQIIDGLGITHTPEDGEFISDAIVILRTVDEDGRVGLRMAYPTYSSWVERVGMFRAALHVELNDLGQDGA